MSEEQTTPPPPPPSQPPPSSGPKDNTLMLVLAYFGILALIPLLVEKDDKEVQWHAKHGLLLFVVWFVLFTIIGFIPFVGCIVVPLGGIAVLVVHIMAIMKATKGERMIIPYLSEYVDRF